MSDDRTIPCKRVGTCRKCGKPVRDSHGWVRHAAGFEHLGSCAYSHFVDALNLLHRVLEGHEDGVLDVPDVLGAAYAELEELEAPSWA